MASSKAMLMNLCLNLPLDLGMAWVSQRSFEPQRGPSQRRDEPSPWASVTEKRTRYNFYWFPGRRECRDHFVWLLYHTECGYTARPCGRTAGYFIDKAFTKCWRRFQISPGLRIRCFYRKQADHEDYTRGGDKYQFSFLRILWNNCVLACNRGRQSWASGYFTTSRGGCKSKTGQIQRGHSVAAHSYWRIHQGSPQAVKQRRQYIRAIKLAEDRAQYAAAKLLRDHGGWVEGDARQYKYEVFNAAECFKTNKHKKMSINEGFIGK